jgi:hypothetical protein
VEGIARRVINGVTYDTDDATGIAGGRRLFPTAAILKSYLEVASGFFGRFRESDRIQRMSKHVGCRIGCQCWRNLHQKMLQLPHKKRDISYYFQLFVGKSSIPLTSTRFYPVECSHCCLPTRI